MALNTSNYNHLTPRGLKGLKHAVVYLALDETKLDTTSVAEFTIVPVRCLLWQKHRVRLLECRERKSWQQTTSGYCTKSKTSV